MRITDKLKKYLHEYQNGEYDDRFYIDTSITKDKNLSFEAVGLLPVLIYYLDKEFSAVNIVSSAEQSKESALKGIENLLLNGYLED